MTHPSAQRLFQAGAISGLLVLLMAAALFLLRPGQPSPIPGTLSLNEAVLCHDDNCIQQEPITLPWRIPMALSDAVLDQTIQIDIPAGDGAARVLYLPRSAPATGATLDGVALRTPLPLGSRQWNRPLQIAIPGGAEGTMRLSLSGHGQEGLELWPMSLGPAPAIAPAHRLRETLTVTAAQAIALLSLLLAVGNTVLYLVLPGRSAHLWLALGNVLSVVFVLQFSTPLPLVGYPLWTVIWTSATCAYAFTLLKFTLGILELPAPRIETAFAGFIGAMLVVGLLAPARFALVYGIAVNAGSFVFGCAILSIVWTNRAHLGRVATAILLACFAAALALGVYEILLVVAPIPISPLTLFHLIPLLMALLSAWLVTSQMVAAFAALSNRADTLEAVVAERTRELEDNFARLARARRAEAIADERRRIMLDLHDGIGGHLVSMKAYMENRGQIDPPLAEALDEAIRDLGLMLDSLENEESLATLLGMMRTRLEGLLARNGLEFVWEIEGDPELPNPSPTNTLHVTRIVQEAITNVIKHANAKRITVYADDCTIAISDDGKGVHVQRTDIDGQGRTRHGLAGMQRRAKAIGADLEISSNTGGTTVCLNLAPRETPYQDDARSDTVGSARGGRGSLDQWS